MPFLWKDDSSSDGPPEKTRLLVQTRVEAHFATHRTKAWRPGTAARALERGIRSLPGGTEDLSALSPQRRLQLEALQAKALREHAQSFPRVKATTTTRTGRAKKHSSLVLVPRCLTPPYTTSVNFTNVLFNDGFVESDARVPLQPNGQSILADTANGVAGQTMVWGFHRGNTGFLDVTRGVLIGGWIQAGNTKPLFLDAQLTAFTFANPKDFSGGATDGWVYLFGGGVSTYQIFTELFVFTDTSQASSNPPVPVMRATVPVVDVTFSALQLFQYTIPAGTRKTITGVASAVSPGTWMLVLAGPVVRFFASVSHADWDMAAGSTWSVDKICGYW
jgi:hypothetical protein